MLNRYANKYNTYCGGSRLSLVQGNFGFGFQMSHQRGQKHRLLLNSLYGDFSYDLIGSIEGQMLTANQWKVTTASRLLGELPPRN